MASSPSNHGTMASSSASAADLQLVSRYWSDFDLEGMRASLDEVGLRVAEHQEEAMQNRKKLAESTKSFRSQYADDPNTKAYGTLLKTYQEEIDKYGCPRPMHACIDYAWLHLTMRMESHQNTAKFKLPLCALLIMTRRTAAGPPTCCRLTKRAKHGEGAFLNLYQKLFEAPDPAPALSQAFETGGGGRVV